MRFELDLKKTLGVLGFGVALAFSTGTAAAQEVTTYDSTPLPVDVEGEGAVREGDLPDEVGSESGQRDEVTPQSGDNGAEVLGVSVSSGSLPVTGGDLVGLAAIGTGAVMLGSAAVLYRRRQPA